MPVTIPDKFLHEMGLSESEAQVEIACRLFDGDILPLPKAATLAGLSRVEMEGELRKRGIAICRPTIQDIEEDLRTLDKLDLAETKP